jgi:hypothetical protein
MLTCGEKIGDTGNLAAGVLALASALGSVCLQSRKDLQDGKNSI